MRGPTYCVPQLQLIKRRRPRHQAPPPPQSPQLFCGDKPEGSGEKAGTFRHNWAGKWVRAPTPTRPLPRVSRRGSQNGRPGAVPEAAARAFAALFQALKFPGSSAPQLPALRFPRRRAGSDLTAVAWRRGALPAAAATVGVGAEKPLISLWVSSCCGVSLARCAEAATGRRRWRWEWRGGWGTGARGRGLPGLPSGFAFRLRGSGPCRLL